MNISALDNASNDLTALIVYTPCDKLELFLYDKIKYMFVKDKSENSNGFAQDAIFKVSSKKDLKQIKDLVNIQPFICRKWMVEVELEKFSYDFKDIINIMKESTTMVFFCSANNYRSYKTLKDGLSKKKVQGVYDLYLNSLRRADFLYLYSKFVPESNKLTKALYDYVAQSYSGDISAVFDLFNELANGVEVKSRSDITKICGIGGNSIETFIFSLLKDVPSTVRGTNTVIRNRLKAGYELSDAYKWGSYYNILNSCLKNILDIKMLCISGSIYKRIVNLPDAYYDEKNRLVYGYEEKKLARYQRYLRLIKEIPLSRILRLKYSLGDTRWSSALDLARFVYTYYTEAIRMEVVREKPKFKVVRN